MKLLLLSMVLAAVARTAVGELQTGHVQLSSACLPHSALFPLFPPSLHYQAEAMTLEQASRIFSLPVKVLSLRPSRLILLSCIF